MTILTRYAIHYIETNKLLDLNLFINESSYDGYNSSIEYDLCRSVVENVIANPTTYESSFIDNLHRSYSANDLGVIEIIMEY